MSVLQSLFPYFALALTYYFQYRRLFLVTYEEPPPHWEWDLVLPPLAAGLTPLAVAAAPELSAGDRESLITATGLAVTGSICMCVICLTRGFYNLRLPLGVGTSEKRAVTGARIVLLLGELIIGACAVTNASAL